MTAPGETREPAAEVIEVTEWDGIPPPVCEGVVITKSALLLSEGVLSRLKNEAGRPSHVGFEDASGVIIIRRQESCRIIPLFKETDGLKGFHNEGHVPDDVSSRIHSLLGGDRDLSHESRKEPAMDCVIPDEDTGCRWGVTDYGVKPLIEGKFSSKPEDVPAGDSSSGVLWGPGETHEYLVRALEDMPLLLEYQTDQGPGTLDIFLGKGKEGQWHQGSISLAKGEEARILLRHRGSGVLKYSVGWLGIPEGPWACEATLKERTPASVQVVWRIRSRSEEGGFLTVPSAGTVSVYADGVLIAGGHPGRLPETVFVPAGEIYAVERTFALPFPAQAITAEWRTPEGGAIVCELSLADTDHSSADVSHRSAPDSFPSLP